MVSSSCMMSKIFLLNAAIAFTTAFTASRVVVHHGSPTQLWVADFSAASSESLSTSSSIRSDDEASKAFLTQKISSIKREDVLPQTSGSTSMWMDSSSDRHPSILPGWVVEGHHPAEFETDGGIMMTEHLEPHSMHFSTAEDLMHLAVSERVAKAIERRGQKPPAVYYFD